MISDFDKAYFWKWTYFDSYIQFTVVFTLVVGLLTWLLLDNMYYVETIGFLAVFAEAMLGAPQFYRNFVNKSTHGMRYVRLRIHNVSNQDYHIFSSGVFIV